MYSVKETVLLLVDMRIWDRERIMWGGGGAGGFVWENKMVVRVAEE